MEGNCRSAFPLPHSAFRLILELPFPRKAGAVAGSHAPTVIFALATIIATIETSRVMIPWLPPEYFTLAIELVCYCCTIFGVVLTFWLVPRW